MSKELDKIKDDGKYIVSFKTEKDDREVFIKIKCALAETQSFLPQDKELDYYKSAAARFSACAFHVFQGLTLYDNIIHKIPCRGEWLKDTIEWHGLEGKLKWTEVK